MPPAPPKDGAVKWIIAIGVSLGALMEIIQTSLGCTLTQVSWVVSGYAIANVIILPLSAWLGNRFGKKNYFVASLVGFIVASILCGFSTSFTMLIVSRILQGLTGGGLLAKAQSILFETFPPNQQAMAQGLFGAVVIAGPTIGPTLGGYIVTNIDWRWIFFINVPIGIGATILCLFVLPPDDRATFEKGRVDWIAILLLAIGIGSLQAFLEEGQTEQWFQSRLIVNLGLAAVVGLVLFVWRDLWSDAPVVNVRMLAKYPSLWAGSILSIVLGISLYGALFSLPIFAQNILQYTSEQTGFMLMPGALMAGFSMPFVAALNRKLDPRVLFGGGSVVLCIALLMLSKLTITTGYDQLFWPLIVRAIGTSMLFMPLILSTLGPIPKKDVASATGFFNLTRQLGGSIGVALLSTMLEARIAFHRAVLVEKLAVADTRVQDRLSAITHGLMSQNYAFDDAHNKATAMLDGMVMQQASVLSFGDTFRATLLLVVLSLPLVLLLGRANPGAKVEAH
jgi:DHA2 family multidrug resistance protein